MVPQKQGKFEQRQLKALKDVVVAVHLDPATKISLLYAVEKILILMNIRI